MKTKLLLRQLANRFPKRYAKMNHDYVGLMTGKLPEEVHKIVLCLDFDQEVLPLVKENKPDLIITHHPFIYGTKYRVFKWDKLKEELCNEIDTLGVPVYSMHTNFDTGKDGMNESLAEALGLQGIYAPEKDIMMRIGELKEAMPVEEFAQFAKAKLNVDYGLLIAEGNPMVKKVMEACRILISSISAAETLATLQAMAFCSMMGRSCSRCAAVIFLESLSKG